MEGNREPSYNYGCAIVMCVAMICLTIIAVTKSYIPFLEWLKPK